MSRKKIMGIGLGFVVIALGISIRFVSRQDTRPTGPLEKITFADAGQPIGGLFHIAIINGYFQNEGLDVSLKRFTSGRDALNAVLQGKYDLATVAETPIMHSALRGEKIYTIATIGTTQKSIAVIGRKDKGISTPGTLKGKKIGVSIGTNGEFFLDTFLLMHGITKNEVEIVNLNPEEMFGALVNGPVDAVSSWEPYLYKLKNELGNKGITFYGEGIYTWTWNIAAGQKFVHKNPEMIKKALRALIKAEEFVQKAPDESVRAVSDYIKMKRAVLGELWGAFNFNVTLGQTLLITLEDEARWAIKNKLTEKSKVPNFLNFIYLDGLAAVSPEAVSIIR